MEVQILEQTLYGLIKSMKNRSLMEIRFVAKCDFFKQIQVVYNFFTNKLDFHSFVIWYGL